MDDVVHTSGAVHCCCNMHQWQPKSANNSQVSACHNLKIKALLAGCLGACVHQECQTKVLNYNVQTCFLSSVFLLSSNLSCNSQQTTNSRSLQGNVVAMNQMRAFPTLSTFVSSVADLMNYDVNYILIFNPIMLHIIMPIQPVPSINKSEII